MYSLFKKIALLSYILSLAPVASYGQDANEIDSLLLVLKRTKGREHIITLHNISHAYLNSDRKIALQYAETALEKAKSLDSLRLISESLNSIGNVHQNSGQYKKSLEIHRQALKIQEKNKDYNGMANSYSGIGLVYDLSGEYASALKYQLLSLDLKKKVGDQKGEAIAYNNIGIIYSELEDHTKSLEYFEKAMIIYRKIGDERRVADELSNLGSVRLELNDYKEAIDYENRSLRIRKQIGDKRGIVISSNNLGSAHSFLGDYEKARSYFRTGIETAKELGDLVLQTDGYYFLSDHFERSGQFKQALEAERTFHQLRDSAFGQDKRKQMTQLQVEFDTERKEKEIELLNQETKLQQAKIKQEALIRNFSIGGSLVILLVFVMLYRQTKIRQESKRKALAHQLQLEKLEGEKLQEIDQLKTRFFTNIAHEFRTPLTLIKGPAEHIMEESREPSTRKMGKLIYRHSNLLLRLVNQLLDISRLDAGMEKLTPAYGDFVAFLKGTVHSFESLADQKNISLDVQSSDEEIYVNFDHDRLEKVFSNLLSNAFKFTPSGGRVLVTITKRKSIDSKESFSLEVKIEDSGVGIPRDQLQAIFDRFYRSDAAPEYSEGTGIGLALAKELVVLHGGTIKVQSEEGAGSTFTVKIPFQENQEPQRTAVPKSSSNVQSLVDEPEMASLLEESQTANPLIEKEHPFHDQEEIVLVVEDNPDVRKFIVHSLQANYRILEAQHGEEGIKMASVHIPDLVISDVMMPIMDGYETCQRLKNNEKTSHIPVILLTAKAGMDSKLEGLETGADDYLAKPFDKKELLARIKNLISTRKKLRQKYLAQTLENQGVPLDSPSKENAFLKKVKEVVETNLDNDAFSVEDLSEHMAMSRTQLHRKLKALTNQSASQFVRVIRLGKGKELLLAGELNVAEVAYQVGFSSPTYFSSCFIEQFGYSPSEIRKGVV